MLGELHRWDWVAAILVAAVLAAFLTPLCTMPSCDSKGGTSCSGAEATCDRCPKGLTMKHAQVEASPAAVSPLAPCAVLALVPERPHILIAFHPLAPPAATASPPPIDPLGVRLSV